MEDEPLATAQRDFVQRYIHKYADDKRQKKRKKKAATGDKKDNENKATTILMEAASDISGKDSRGDKDT